MHVLNIVPPGVDTSQAFERTHSTPAPAECLGLVLAGK